VRTTRESGTGGPGTVYRNTSRFLGRTTELRYVVTDHRAPREVALRGENRTVVAHDTITLTEAGPGRVEITYRARFTFKGWTRLLGPLTAPAFRRLGDKAADGLRAALAPDA
jgi:Polyketide cyclase / dehydrase and lipid transport